MNKAISENKVDTMLSEFFCETQRSLAAEKIIPTSQILQSKTEFFNSYLSKPHLRLKLFLFFQPFSKSNLQIDNKFELQKAIITKIFGIKQNQITGPIFFSEKIIFTLVYFYETLKSLKNLEVMNSLRLLFLGVEEWTYFDQVEIDILEAIDHPFLKMLKIAEFILLNNSILAGFE